MDEKTTIAQGLHSTDDSAGYDAACKRVLSEKAILARIMKACLEEYIRMRDDANNTLKRIKQQTSALCTRHGKQYDGKSYWTRRHLEWLDATDFGNAVLNEVLKEYLVLYRQAQEKVDVYDKRIMELSQGRSYQELVQNLGCFIGIKEHTALAFCCEVGDFRLMGDY